MWLKFLCGKKFIDLISNFLTLKLVVTKRITISKLVYMSLQKLSAISFSGEFVDHSCHWLKKKAERNTASIDVS